MEFKSVTPKKGEYLLSDQAFKRIEAETCRTLVTEWYLYNFRLALLRAAGDAGNGVKCVSPPGPFGEKLRAAGFEWDALPFERDSRLGMLLSLCVRAAR